MSLNTTRAKTVGLNKAPVTPPVKASKIKDPAKKSHYFKDLITAFKNGDKYVRLSALFMGTGYIARKQVIKGILVQLLQILYILAIIFYAGPSFAKFDTLGTVEFAYEKVGLNTRINNYDNSFLILLNSIVGFFAIFVFILLWIHNIKAVYDLQKRAEKGRPINNFRQDIHSLVEGNFHITLLALPTIGVILINILPILILIAIAFTNYGGLDHTPPTHLFTWTWRVKDASGQVVGKVWDNFAQFFNSTNSNFNYAFWKIAGWTLLWALLATFTCFIGGILLAKLINSDGIKFRRMWRTLFIITIAVPQFVSLILVRNFFRDSGIFNTMCSDIGLTKLLYNLHLIPTKDYIPFLTNPKWTKFMIVMINIWVGVPYQMLIATGVLMNIPKSQVESARLDGANNFQVFVHIIMPYFLVVQGPALITDFVRNINNFNVIYLLTQDVYTTHDLKMAAANAKEPDLLVTWLFRLTNENASYNIASVIGIIVFIACATFTLISFGIMMRGNKEEDYR